MAEGKDKAHRADRRKRPGPTGGPAEDLTVVIVPIVRGPALQACVRAVTAQGVTPWVVDAAEPPLDGGRFLPVVPRDQNVPRRRARSLLAAETPFVLFIEDTFTPAEGWIGAIRQALLQPGVGAAGGVVAVATSLAPRFRALGLCEYGLFQAGRGPAAPSEIVLTERVPCGAFGVRRDLLRTLAASEFGLVDNAIFAAVRSAGAAVALVPAAVVVYAAEHRQAAQLISRVQHGRLYGGMFSRNRALASRLIHGLATTLVPALLIGRTLRAAPRWLWRSPATLAWVVSMCVAWAIGEAVGKLTGDVGDALARWD